MSYVMIIIRKAILSNAIEIAKMHAESFAASLKPFAPKKQINSIDKTIFQIAWSKRLSKQNGFTYVAIERQKIIGMINFTFRNSTAEILRLYVHPDYWRKKIGKRLMSSALKFLNHHHVKKIKIWVMKKNPKSRAFYEAMGAYPSRITRKILVFNLQFIEILYYLKLDKLSKTQTKNEKYFTQQKKKLVA